MPPRKYKFGQIVKSRKSGYKCIYLPLHRNSRSGCVLLHRWIFEKNIRRFLKKDEHVHHIDENIHNNNIENLKIMSPSEHMELHQNKKNIMAEHFRDITLETIYKIFEII